MPAITGPKVDPHGGKADALVVFLHGYGANGDDLIELGRQWRALLPQAAFVAPNAPDRCPGAPTGRQWFPLAARAGDEAKDAEHRWQGALAARPGLDAFLDDSLAERGLDDSRLALVGFSQGTMMALHVGLRRKRAPAAILGYSGMLIGPEHLPEATARDAKGQRPPILLVHGDRDNVIPLDAMFVAADDLARAEIPVQWHLSIGVAHGIDGGGLSHGGLFLQKAFARK